MTGRPWWCVLVPAIGLIAGHGFADAQERTAEPRVVLERAAGLGWHLRITVVDSAVLEGRVRRLDDATMTIGDYSIRPPEILIIERRRIDRSAGIVRGSIAGGLAGLIGGGLFFGSLCASRDTSCSGAKWVAVSTVSLAAIGGLLGGAISEGKVVWEEIWSRD